MYGIGPTPRKNKEYHFQNVWVFDNLLLDHVGLPNVLVVTVHLVIFLARWVGGSTQDIFSCKEAALEV